LSGDDRVGTFGIYSLGGTDIEIATLYVRPDHRRQGLATRAIEATCDATREAGAEVLRIATNWCWQDAVRFYTHRGLWVRNWKQALVFSRRADLWPYRVDIHGSTARFSVFADGVLTPLFEATNGGDVLHWAELPTYAAMRDSSSWVYYQAPGTFALHLALAGWPLIRSEELWEQRDRWSDAGQPGGLALKIAVFEGVDRAQNYDVRTPRIPGLDYRVAKRWLGDDRET